MSGMNAMEKILTITDDDSDPEDNTDIHGLVVANMLTISDKNNS